MPLAGTNTELKLIYVKAIHIKTHTSVVNKLPANWCMYFAILPGLLLMHGGEKWRSGHAGDSATNNLPCGNLLNKDFGDEASMRTRQSLIQLILRCLQSSDESRHIHVVELCICTAPFSQYFSLTLFNFRHNSTRPWSEFQGGTLSNSFLHYTSLTDTRADVRMYWGRSLYLASGRICLLLATRAFL